MNKKETYSKPEIDIIEVEMANVIAASDPTLDVSDDVHPGGDSMSNGFWESGFIN